MSGKRHGFHAQWRVGFDDDGRLQALDATLTVGRRLEPRPVRAGAGPRAVPHRQRLLDPQRARERPDREDQQDVADGVPRVRRAAGDARHRGHPRPLRARCSASTPPTCAAATSTREGQTTPYGQPVRHPERLAAAWDQVLDVERRRASGSARSRSSTPRHEHTKRGLAMTPVKFGISFNLTAFNQAGALVHVYKDGSVLINHGGTEMGQGLHTKMLQVAATTLGVPLARVRLAPDAHRQGAQHLGDGGELGCRPQRRRGQERLRADPRRGCAQVAAERLGVSPADVRFGDGRGARARRLRRARPVGGARRTGLLPAGAAVGGRLLPHRGSALGLLADARVAVQVLRLRRRRRPRSRSTGSPAPTAPGGSTSSTTSATASRRWSTSARSRAGSCRAPAG